MVSTKNLEHEINHIRFENIPNNLDHKFMIAWLEKNIEPASKHNKEDGHPIPYYASATSQIAKYAGQTSLWHLQVWGPQMKKIVEITDPKLAVKFALECTYAK
jgi:hypothetical protein